MPLTISSPTVIYLTGFKTTDTQQQYIAGDLRDLKNLFHRQDTPSPQIYAWSYSNLRNVFNLAAYNFRPEKSCSATAEKIAANIILPLVSANGQPLPRTEAQKRLRNLTFFGYSAGTILAQETFNASLKQMQQIGYKPEDARKLLHEIVLVSAGNVSRPAKEHDRFTTLYLAASDDKAVCWKNRLWSPLRRTFFRQSEHLTIKPLSATSLLITAAAKEKAWQMREARHKSRTNPLIPFKRFTSSNHALSHYITRNDAHSPFSRIALHALINAVNRKSTPDILQLLEPPASLAPAEKAAYCDRIAKAKRRMTG